MIFSLSKIYLVLIIFLSTLQQISCIASIPLTFSEHPNIQSRTVDVVYINPGTDSASVTYSKPKATSPAINYVFVGIMQVNYRANTIVDFTAFLFYLNTNNLMVFPTYLKITVYHLNNRIGQLTFSVLIFDNQFPQRSQIVDGFSFIYNKAGGALTYNLNLQNSNYTVLKFINMLDMRTMGPTFPQIALNWNDTYSAPTLTAQILYIGSYQWAWTGVKFLAIYPPQFPPYPMKLQTYTYQFVPSPWTFYAKIDYFNTSYSNYVFGLNAFQYNAVNNPINPGFSFTSILFVSATNPNSYNLQLALDDQFARINYHMLVISSLTCTDPLYPIRHTSHIDGVESCFDSCYQGEFISMNITGDYLICSPCGSALCMTCEVATRCSSCIAFYDMDESGACSLNPEYYQDTSSGSSIILPCSNIIPNCLTCDALGSICNTCDTGYYVSGGACTACTSVASNCIDCSSTQCFSCQSPSVLINQTFCSSPLAPPIPPAIALPCSDINCMACSQPNVSNCLMCISSFLTLRNGKCISVCGDGLIAGADVCDDGNTQSYDGCSYDCNKIQDGFTCDLISSVLAGYSKSKCYFNRKIQLNAISIKKSLSQNKLSIILKNKQPQILEWKQIDLYDQLQDILVFEIPKFSNGVMGYGFNYHANFIKSIQEIMKIKNTLEGKIVISQTRNLQNVSFSSQLYEYILLEIWYNLNGMSEEFLQSLSHQQAQIYLNPALSQRSVFTQSSLSLNSLLKFELITDDNHIIQFYSSDYYDNVDKMYLLSIFVSLLTIIIFLIGIICYFLQGTSSKQILMALQTAFIVQLTYFSLYGIGQLNPLFIQMAKGLKYSTGYDVTLSQSLTSARQLKAIDITSANIMNNVNISLGITIICAILGSFVLCLSKLICKSKTTSHQIQQQQTQQYQKPQQTKKIQIKRPFSQKILNLGSFLLFNLGFALMLLFMYKFIVFSCFQILYESLSMMSITIIGVIFAIFLGYILLFILKLPLFHKFTQKINKKQTKIGIFSLLACKKQLSSHQIKRIQKRFQNYVQLLPDSDKPQCMKKIQHDDKGTSINPKLWYVIVIIVQHLINSFALALLGQRLTYNQILPISIYIFQFVFVAKQKFYAPADLWRLQGTYFIGIVIQIIFLIQSILMNSLSSKAGGQQTSIGIYFPFSIIILLVILCLTTLVYVIYSIKKLRCCQLQIQWQKIQMSVAMKLKLQSIVKEQMQKTAYQEQVENDPIKLQKQKQNIYTLGQTSPNDMNESCKHILKDQQTSFNSSKHQEYFNSPLNSPIKGVLSMISEQQNKIKIKLNPNINYESVKINQQVTTKQIKKQIKEKLSNHKISQKIRTFGEEKMENILALQMFKQQENKVNQRLPQIKMFDETSKLVKSKISPQISSLYNKLKQTHEQKNSQHAGYIYTDKNVYDTNEEFDMI